jgi:hypothetical protein
MIKKRRLQKLQKSINQSIDGVIANIGSINLDNYLLLNGTLDKNGLIIGEYFKFNRDTLTVELIHILLDNISIDNYHITNDILTINIRTLLYDYKEKIVAKKKLSDEDFYSLESKVNRRIQRYFIYNSYGGLAISIDYINRYLDSLQINSNLKIDSYYELFNRDLFNKNSKKILNAKNIEDLYLIFQK